MVAGYDRYFQIAHCMRDEDLRGDRQPEFTQIDLETAFVREEDVMAAVEAMVTAVSAAVVPQRPLLASPFPRLTYEEAMARYGSDKPDLRFGMGSSPRRRPPDPTSGSSPTLSPGRRGGGFRAPGCAGYTRKQLLRARPTWPGATVRAASSTSRWTPMARCEVRRRNSSATPMRPFARRAARARRSPSVVADDDRTVAQEALGHLRLEMGERLGLRDPDVLGYVWVHRFPMFTWDPDGNRWDATHNPFSAPVWEEADTMEANPASVHAQQYDLALNGWELGGGSVRIHRRDLLERAFALMGHTIEGMRDQFGALLDALEFGAPPHGGIALGLDRWAALLAKQSNIREVMAFPKTQSGGDLMMGAPAPISPQQLASSAWRCFRATDPSGPGRTAAVGAGAPFEVDLPSAMV